MSTTDVHRITTVEQLRARIGEPSAVVPLKLWKSLNETAVGFIKKSPFLLLATADAEGNMDVSPKGDGPGFVEIENDTTLIIPDRSGNKLIFGLQNILHNPHVGLIFLIPGTGETFRVNGRAELTADPVILERLSARGKPAVVAIRVTIEECFLHCAKAFLRANVWKPDHWSEQYKISFGKLLVEKMGGDEKTVKQFDEFVENDYKNNL
ncbi:MAG: pyridoxamine 5'-phosphate oxidase family protein [Deltaproteobacteria bacterium]|nr:pyridoxamine 5'-phosphate oxidase family protein [Deltaproteobacteria bacterium]